MNQKQLWAVIRKALNAFLLPQAILTLKLMNVLSVIVNRTDTILSTFQLFMNKWIISEILKWTKVENKENYEWKTLEQDEQQKFFGLLILAGVYKSKNEVVTQLWNKSHGRPIFSQTMARNRFSEITNCLRFDDAEKHR